MAERVALILAALIAGAAIGSAPAQAGAKQREAELARLVALLPGTYDNREQVEAERSAGRTTDTPVRLVIVRIYAPFISWQTFYVREAALDDTDAREEQRDRGHGGEDLDRHQLGVFGDDPVDEEFEVPTADPRGIGVADPRFRHYAYTTITRTSPAVAFSSLASATFLVMACHRPLTNGNPPSPKL